MYQNYCCYIDKFSDKKIEIHLPQKVKKKKRKELIFKKCCKVCASKKIWKQYISVINVRINQSKSIKGYA